MRATSQHRRHRDQRRRQYGQALLEFAVTLPLLTLLVFGVIDFSRAIYQQQVLTGLTRDSSSMAARGTALADAAGLLVSGTALPLNLNLYGKVVITAVINNGSASAPAYQVLQQYSTGQCQGCGSSTSLVSATGAVGSTAVMPALPTGGLAFPQPGQTIYVTEIFYRYQAATPIGRLLVNVAIPAQSYDVAYI